jgi:adenylate kinase
LKKLRLVITGNPGVGKHTSAKIIAEKVGMEIIDLNQVAIENNAIAKKTDRSLEIDIKRLVRVLEKLLKTKKDLLLVGHLAPYVIKPAGISLVAVLRRSPYELEKTLKKRGYSVEKVQENLASEILGISLYDSLRTFGKRKVAEFDTTSKNPEQTADEIIAALHKKPELVGLDWLLLVSEKNDMQKFFKY